MNTVIFAADLTAYVSLSDAIFMGGDYLNQGVKLILGWRPDRRKCHLVHTELPFVTITLILTKQTTISFTRKLGKQFSYFRGVQYWKKKSQYFYNYTIFCQVCFWDSTLIELRLQCISKYESKPTVGVCKSKLTSDSLTHSFKRFVPNGWFI